MWLTRLMNQEVWITGRQYRPMLLSEEGKPSQKKSREWCRQSTHSFALVFSGVSSPSGPGSRNKKFWPWASMKSLQCCLCSKMLSACAPGGQVAWNAGSNNRFAELQSKWLITYLWVSLGTESQHQSCLDINGGAPHVHSRMICANFAPGFYKGLGDAAQLWVGFEGWAFHIQRVGM